LKTVPRAGVLLLAVPGIAMAVCVSAASAQAAPRATPAGPATAGRAIAGPATIQVGSNPDGIAVDTTTDTVYVANEGDDSVSVIDGATGTVMATILVGSSPRGIAVDETTDTVYVANSGDQTVSVIDGATDEVSATLTIGADPDAVAVDPVTDTIFVSWYDGIAKINGATDAVTPEAIFVPATGIDDSMTIDSANGYLYLVNYASGQVYVFDAVGDNGQVGYFDAGSEPDALAVDPVDGLLYVGSCESGYASGVWVINLATGDWESQLSDGCPAAVAVDTATGTAFSVDENAGMLSFIAGQPAPWVTGSVRTGIAPCALAVDPATGVVYVVNHTLSGTVTVFQSAAPSITSTAGATFTVRSPASFQAVATGFPAATFTERGALPRGVSMTWGGLFSGTPDPGSGGVYRIVLTAANGVAQAATQDFVLTVRQPAAITSGRTATFVLGRSHTFRLTTSGFPAAVLTEHGKLPKGLVFRTGKGGTATISGRPATADQRRTYVIRLVAANGVGPAATQTFDLRIR